MTEFLAAGFGLPNKVRDAPGFVNRLAGFLAMVDEK